MSEVVNPDAAAAAAAERPAMVTDPAPMVSAASGGTPQATSGGTASSTTGSGNVQTAGTAAGLQNFQGVHGTPQAD